MCLTAQDLEGDAFRKASVILDLFKLKILLSVRYYLDRIQKVS